MTPRDYAVLTLDDKRLPGMPGEAFKRRSAVAPTDSRDRALAEHLVLGVVKNFLHLQRLIELFADRPISQVDPRARLILAVAIYQLRFLDRVPDHALVTEAVRQTRSLGEPTLGRAAGFVNAVLREAIRSPDVHDKLPPRTDAPAYGELVLSHPRTLFAKLAELLGPADALRFCEHDNRTPPTLLRLAAGHETTSLTAPAEGEPAAEYKSPREGEPPGEPFGTGDLEGDSAAGSENGSPGGASSRLEVVPHEQSGIVVVRGAKQADFARWSDAGVGQVQDATSAAVVPHLDVRDGMTVLDRCCGVGTKTQQLADAVGHAGRVFAVDAAGKRVSTLRALVARRPDLSVVKAKRAEWLMELPADWPTVYDRILIDAPCSNTGVLARRAEARYSDIEKTTAELVELQLAILRDTWPALAAGGVLVYATCSVLPDENGNVVRRFLADQPAAELVEEAATLPSFATDDPTRYRDGGYYALLRREVR